MVTNRYNLPQALVNLTKEKEYQENRYSITELLNPTREILLLRKHAKEIEIDVSDTISTLFGSAVHKLLEEADSENAEVKMEYVLEDGTTIVGIADKIGKDAIEDYKTCTVSKVSKSDFSEWRDQGLGYAWLHYKLTGEIKRKLKFYALIKDWSKLQASKRPNYPVSPLYTWEYDIKDSDYDYIEQKIKDKLADIKSGNMTQCSLEDRWYTGDEYAVFKNVGDKRAAMVTADEQEAHDYITNKLGGTGEIQVRKGESLKCKYYCKVAKFCEYAKED